MAKSVFVLSNCTHTSIAECLRSTHAFSRVSSMQLFDKGEVALNEIAQEIDGFDFILGATHSEKFGPLASTQLRRRFGDRYVEFPVLFFSGLAPDWCYVSRNPGGIVGSDLTSDYQNGVVLTLLQHGLSPEEVVEIYKSGVITEILDLSALWDASVNALVGREECTRIKLSGFVADASKDVQTFYTFNHPSSEVITEVVNQFLGYAGIDAPQPSLPPQFHNLINGVYMPVFRAFGNVLGLSYSTPQLYVTGESPAPKWIGAAEMIHESAKSLSKTLGELGDAESLKINSPDYLRRCIRLDRVDSVIQRK